MTNRGRAHDPGMKCLTLTFNMENTGRSVTGPRPKTRNGGRTPGYLPQPKHSVKTSSNRKFTASPRQISAHFYQRKLNSDIDGLLIEDEPVRNPPPPKLPRSQNRPTSAHSTASSKSDHHSEYLRIAQCLSLNSPLLTARASSSIAPKSFLIDDLQNRPFTEISEKLGRPTRTSLLRNRQRSNSAPVTTYETREEVKRRNQLLIDLDQRNRPNTAANTKETYVSHDMEGESLHAFLTGARYNRAHYVDAKSLSKYGVYMPRGNPRACFINDNKPKTSPAQHHDTSPCAPSESPVSDDVDGEEDDQQDLVVDTDNSTPAPPCTPAPQVSVTPQPTLGQQASQHMSEQQMQAEFRPRSGRSSSRQAWGESSASLEDVESVSDGYTERHNYLSKSPSTGPKLNITGRKMNYGGVRSPATPVTPTAHPYNPHPYDSDSVPPPPPSVDFSSHIRLDLHGFQTPRHRAHAHSEHSRTVRFSEPDEFGVQGKSIATPRGSPTHSRSILKTDELKTDDLNHAPKSDHDSVKFFMTEEPEPPVGLEPVEDTPVVEEVAGDVTQTGGVEQADDVTQTGGVTQTDDVTQTGDVEQADDVVEPTDAETRSVEVEEDVTNILTDVSAQWMQEAGVEEPGEGGENENDEETSMKPVTAVDIARKPASPAESSSSQN